ncbi:hypothetical protein [Accumulibacter sp.]|uniref:hypothetical protein n=1 Tax=Accumulibacter sp. TaxID=2053492 RepID=UPI0035B27FF9
MQRLAFGFSGCVAGQHGQAQLRILEVDLPQRAPSDHVPAKLVTQAGEGELVEWPGDPARGWRDRGGSAAARLARACASGNGLAGEDQSRDEVEQIGFAPALARERDGQGEGFGRRTAVRLFGVIEQVAVESGRVCGKPPGRNAVDTAFDESVTFQFAQCASGQLSIAGLLAQFGNRGLAVDKDQHHAQVSPDRARPLLHGLLAGSSPGENPLRVDQIGWVHRSGYLPSALPRNSSVIEQRGLVEYIPCSASLREPQLVVSSLQQRRFPSG